MVRSYQSAMEDADEKMKVYLGSLKMSHENMLIDLNSIFNNVREMEEKCS